MKRYLIIMLLALSLPLAARNPYKGEVKVIFDRTLRSDGEIRVRADIRLDSVTLDRNQVVVFTPKLVSADGSREFDFPQTIISGKRRTRITTRENYFGASGLDTSADNYYMLAGKDRVRNIPLEYSITPQEWMQGARFQIHEQTYGCYGCEKSRTYPDGSQLKVYLQPLREPAFEPSYLIPPVEPVKIRSETYSARLQFVVDKSNLVRNFSTNGEILDELDAIIESVRNNPLLTVRSITVKGYASPEGPRENNLRLSRDRAAALAAYLHSKHNFHDADRLISSEGYGEDWEGLRKAVASSRIASKDEVLSIIDNVTDTEQRKANLKALDGGRTYRILIDEYCPPLRRNEYTIEYEVRNLNQQEAAKLIWEKPELLSLNEMFMVARLYDPESEEFKRIFEIAARLHPDSTFAMFNVAASRLLNEDYAGAAEHFSVFDGPEAWSNLGVVYWYEGKYEEALRLFERASSAGNEAAGVNIREHRKWREIHLK